MFRVGVMPLWKHLPRQAGLQCASKSSQLTLKISHQIQALKDERKWSWGYGTINTELRWCDTKGTFLRSRGAMTKFWGLWHWQLLDLDGYSPGLRWHMSPVLGRLALWVMEELFLSSVDGHLLRDCGCVVYGPGAAQDGRGCSQVTWRKVLVLALVLAVTFLSYGTRMGTLPGPEEQAGVDT